MLVKLLFWMSVMLLAVGGILAMKCDECEVEDGFPNACYSNDSDYYANQKCDREAEKDDPHCVTLALGTKVVEKMCVTLEFVQKIGGKGNDCIEVTGEQYDKVYFKPKNPTGAQRTSREGKGRFLTDSNAVYEFCSCRGDNCNSGDASPFGAFNKKYESLAPTKKPDSGAPRSSLGVVESIVIAIMCLILTCRIYGV